MAVRSFDDNLASIRADGLNKSNEPALTVARAWNRSPFSNIGERVRKYTDAALPKSFAGWRMSLFCPLYREIYSLLSSEN